MAATTSHAASMKRMASFMFTAIVVCIALSVTVLAASFVAAPQALARAPIAFPLWEQDAGVCHIWSVTNGPSSARPLTTGAVIDLAPAWSPSRTTVAFLRSTSRDPYDQSSRILMLMDSDGSDQRQLTYEGPTLASGTSVLAYSRDGRYLAGGCFLSQPNHRAVVLLDLKTRRSRIIQRFDSEGDILSLSWSPDSRQLLVSVEYGGGAGGWRIDVPRRRVVNRYQDMTGSLSWRPDGKYILCTRFDYPGKPLFTELRRPDGALVKTLGREQNDSTYSPDGRAYAFVSLSSVGYGSTLKCAAGDGSHIQTVFKASADQYIYPPAWQ